jgi:hypothetical protein
MMANISERLRSISIDLSAQNTGCRCFRGRVGKRGVTNFGVGKLRGRQYCLPCPIYLLVQSQTPRGHNWLIHWPTILRTGTEVLHRSKHALSLETVRNRCHKSPLLHHVSSIQFTASLLLWSWISPATWHHVEVRGVSPVQLSTDRLLTLQTVFPVFLSPPQATTTLFYWLTNQLLSAEPFLSSSSPTDFPHAPPPPPISFSLIWSFEWYLVRSTEHKTPCYVVFSTPLLPRSS